MSSLFHIRLYGDCTTAPLPVSFEEAAEKLSSIPNLHFEWDGSFVWKHLGSPSGEPWQIDGMLYDAYNRIQYVELKGCCDREAWKLLMRALGACDAINDPQVSSNTPAIHLVERNEWVPMESFAQRYLI